MPTARAALPAPMTVGGPECQLNVLRSGDANASDQHTRSPSARTRALMAKLADTARSDGAQFAAANRCADRPVAAGWKRDADYAAALKSVTAAAGAGRPR